VRKAALFTTIPDGKVVGFEELMREDMWGCLKMSGKLLIPMDYQDDAYFWGEGN